MLNELDLNFDLDNVGVEILWAQAFIGDGEFHIKKHVHSSYEFHFFAEGFHTIFLEDRENTIGPGNFCITPPGVYHGGICHSGTTNIEYNINCDFVIKDNCISEAMNMLQIVKENPSIFHEDTLGIIKLFDEALHEAYFKRFGYFSAIKSLLAKIIMLSARVVIEQSSITIPQSQIKQKKSSYIFDLAKAFMEDNIRSLLTAHDIAQHLFLSTKQVNRIIKSNTGISTMEYLADIRLKKAREMLKLTPSGISEIASSLGFSSEYYFSQFFKRMEGCSPSTYRNLANPKK